MSERGRKWRRRKGVGFVTILFCERESHETQDLVQRNPLALMSLQDRSEYKRSLRA